MDSPRELHAVTGAFGYSGAYIARRLLSLGHEVLTLTNTSPAQDPYDGRVRREPLHFDDHARMVESLRGVSVFYNTYWVRFNHATFNHNQAVENTLKLFHAAREAGVKRFVHVSITNPSEDSPFEYFRGKARLERGLKESGLSHAILRPAVLFGGRDILLNNIAWILRRAPVFGVFGFGKYRLQPIHVEDLADLAVEHGRGTGDLTVQAIGPETFTYAELVRAIGRIIGCERPLFPMPPLLGYLAGRVVGAMTGDVTITWEEIGGLMADLLYVDAPPAGKRRFTEWAMENRATLGMEYASELSRRK